MAEVAGTQPQGWGEPRHYWGAAASGLMWGGWCPIWFAPTDCPWPPLTRTVPREPPSRQGPRRQGKCRPWHWKQLKRQNKKLLVRWKVCSCRNTEKARRTNSLELETLPCPAPLSSHGLCLIGGRKNAVTYKVPTMCWVYIPHYMQGIALSLTTL